MNIQIYYYKKNFDVQKAERYFKERRIPFQLMDLRKHRLGERELRLMISYAGIEELMDRSSMKAKEHPAYYYDRESLLIPALIEDPWLMKSPVVRNGSSVTVGFTPEVWENWK